MAKWAITYNGFGTEGETVTDRWSHVNVNSMSSEPVYGSDGVSLESVTHTIAGTAMISQTTEANYRTALLTARRKLAQHLDAAAPASLRVYLDYTDTTGTNEMTAGVNSYNSVAGIDTATETTTNTENDDMQIIYYGSEEDDYGIPTCQFDITEVFGTATAIVAFTISWNKLEPPHDDTDWQVLHHSWTQSFDIDENGLTTMVVEGDLKVRHFIQGQQDYTGDTTKGTNPDRYRSLVMPNVPSNFRLQSMNWSTDRSGNQLVYRVTLKEHSRPLPYPAKTGTGRFSYSKGMSGQNFLGTKIFDGELEGDPKSSPAELLNSLIRIAASRIHFGGSTVPQPGSTSAVDQIQSVQVTEHDIFSRKKISLRIVATGLDTTSVTGQDNDPLATGPGFGLLKPFFDADSELALSTRPNVYGASLIQSVKKQLFVPWNITDNANWTDSTLPTSSWRSASEWAGEETQTTFEDIEEDTDETPPAVGEGELSHAEIETTGHSTKPYLHVLGTERITSNTNIVVMSAQSRKGQDIPYQVGKPIVTIESEYQLTRLGEPPKRLHLSKPANAITLSESFDVSRGPVDANNNNTYIAVYRRVIRLLDVPGVAGFYNTRAYVPGYGNVEFRAWWPAGGELQLPVDHRIEMIADEFYPGRIDRSVFTTDGNPLPGELDKSWKLGPRPSILGEQ